MDRVQELEAQVALLHDERALLVQQRTAIEADAKEERRRLTERVRSLEEQLESKELEWSRKLEDESRGCAPSPRERAAA